MTNQKNDDDHKLTMKDAAIEIAVTVQALLDGKITDFEFQEDVLEIITTAMEMNLAYEPELTDPTSVLYPTDYDDEP